MNGLNCIKCFQQFDSSSCVPLVLPCGDSVCIRCLIVLSNQPNNLYKCDCLFIYEVNNLFIANLPKNKAIISLVSNKPQFPQKNGPSPKVLFNTPEPKRVTASPDKNFGFLTPSTYQSPVLLSSPNSVKMRCARVGCNNDRYYINGEIWDYCCINCRELDNFNHY